jgi:Tol biopolymer transport system component
MITVADAKRIRLLYLVFMVWWLCAPAGALPWTLSQADVTRVVRFDTQEGTWISLDVSPDGGTVIFDLLGDIYSIPASGGRALLIRGGASWDHMPRFSRDGRRIAFISDADGLANIWTMNVDGTGARQISREARLEVSSPVWSADGLEIFAIRGRSSNSVHRDYGVWRYPTNGGVPAPVYSSSSADTAPNGPDLSPDGRYLYFSVGSEQSHRIVRLDLAYGSLTNIDTQFPGFSPRLSPNGRFLAYGAASDGATILRLRDLQSSVEFTLSTQLSAMDNGEGSHGRIPNFAFSPDSRFITLSEHGGINRRAIEGGTSEPIPFTAQVAQSLQPLVRPQAQFIGRPTEVRQLRDLNLAPDSRHVVYSALGKIWVTDLLSGVSRRLTNARDREYMPSLSPDGSRVAYVSWTDRSGGRVCTVPVTGGECAAVTRRPRRYINPAWSPDGEWIAFLEDGLGYGRPGSQLDIRRVRVGSTHDQLVTSFRTEMAMNQRGYPPLTITRDHIYFTANRAETPNTLYSISLNDSEVREITSSRSALYFVPSPDECRVAIVEATRLFVAEMPDRPGRVGCARSIDLGQAGILVTNGGASFVRWRDQVQLMWTFVDRVYTWALTDRVRRQVADIDLRPPLSVRPERVLAISGARVITMRGDEIIERGTIIINGERIVQVGHQSEIVIPPGARVIDASGMTIMPGLIDGHAHVHAEVGVLTEMNPDYLLMLSYGVTSLFDPSTYSNDAFTQQELSRFGEIISPRIFLSGVPIYGMDRTGRFALESIDDARIVASQYDDLGASILKSYQQPLRQQRRWLARAASELRLGITAELVDRVIGTSLILDGYTAVEHNSPISPAYQDVINLLSQSGTVLTPTLLGPSGTPDFGPPQDGWAYICATDGLFAGPRIDRFAGQAPWCPDQVANDFSIALNHTRDMARVASAGGIISAGSHAAMSGPALHAEMWLMVDGGFTNLQAIRAATISNAYKLGLQDSLGSLEAGKLADLVVVSGDPSSNIRDSDDTVFTVANGVVYDARTLDQRFPHNRRLGEMYWQRR